MGRSPCCAKVGLNRGAWTTAEDKILTHYIQLHGEGSWRNLPKKAGLKRCGKSCRLRWLNYLRPDIKRGNISPDEEELIIRLHKLLGNRWSLIAGRLPGRTDNEIKNYWNTNLCKKVHNRHCPNQSSVKNKKEKPNMSQVVRTKAVRCTKVFINPQPQKSEPTGNMIVSGPPPKTSTSSTTLDDNPPLDLMVDVNMEEDVFLLDFMNSDLAGQLDFFTCGGGDRSNDLSASLDEPPLVFSEDMTEDWTVNNCHQQNVASNHHDFAPFLDPGGGWLAE